MRVSDLDQEVKDSAILCVGMLLSKEAYNQAEQTIAIQVLIDRMTNEMTRLSAVKALQTAMNNPAIASVIPVMIIPEVSTISSFLRKNQRQLRVTSLNLSVTLIRNGLKKCEDILIELPQLINDQDLHVSQLGEKDLKVDCFIIILFQLCIWRYCLWKGASL